MNPFITAGLFVGANIMLWLCVLGVQIFESRRGLIRPRARWGSPQPFLYFQDWSMATWGDWIGLSFIDWTVGYAIAHTHIPLLLVIGALLLGAAGTAFFHIRCLYFRHRPDAGYPAHGKVSYSGTVHLVYFFLQSIACALALFTAIAGLLSPAALAVATLGGTVYIISFIADWRAGKLSPDPRL